MDTFNPSPVQVFFFNEPAHHNSHSNKGFYSRCYEKRDLMLKGWHMICIIYENIKQKPIFYSISVKEQKHFEKLTSSILVKVRLNETKTDNKTKTC